MKLLGGFIFLSLFVIVRCGYEYSKKCNAYVEKVGLYCAERAIKQNSCSGKPKSWSLSSMTSNCNKCLKCKRQNIHCLIKYLKQGPGKSCIFAENLVRTYERLSKNL